MKLPIRYFFLIFACFAILMPNLSQACDRSKLQLDSIVQGAAFLDIHLTMFLGGGITGAGAGAGGETLTFGFLFYGSETLLPLQYPTELTSDSTNATYQGVNAGKAFDSDFTIAYIYNGIPFTCISSTSQCGNRHTDVKSMTFRVTELPDSIRLAGIEGAGNAFAGCYPDEDMLVTFSSLPVVWSQVSAQPVTEGALVKWSTSSELNVENFQIQHSVDGRNYEAVGVISPAGGHEYGQTYSFLHKNVTVGQNFYRIQQRDHDGKTSTSKVVTLDFTPRKGVDFISISPNPCNDRLNLYFVGTDQATISVTLRNSMGQLVFTETSKTGIGDNNLQLDFSRLPRGAYFLNIRCNDSKISKQICRL